MSIFRNQRQIGVTMVVCACLVMITQNASGQEAEIRTLYATESGMCAAGPDTKVEILEGRIAGPGFRCELGESDPVGSGLVNYAASCVVDGVASTEAITLDLGNYSDHFELALPGREEWLALYPCTPVPGLETTDKSESERVTSTEWTCRNTDFEIACDVGGCSASETHTPMEASVGLTAISVCAYSGCWEGTAVSMHRSGTFLTVTGTALPFSSAPDDRADISVTIETGSRVGTLLVAGRYATPAICQQR